ncbi:MAG: biopolymer transporter ExbD [Verrucomicrobia bacterium]|jgi:biopolymer transport protein ExbD|nr:biopolymer transporter ExbD [Verrucomicrobiota bacterium]
MSKRGSILQDEAEMSDINISPMIDMVFILLIFFIVTTVFVQEPGVEVERERARSALDLEKNSILIAITPDGEVVYGGSNIGVVGVRGVVKRLTADNERMPVILQADRAAPSSTVIRVIDEAKLANPASVVSISTETP